MEGHELDGGRLDRLARASSLALAADGYADVPEDVFAEVQAVCVGLPEVTENPAWAGTQWRVRNRVFAHVITVDFPDGPVTALTFRSSGDELDALRRGGHPFYRPAWGADAVGLVLDTDTGVDWDDVRQLLTESYCVVAPRKLVAQLDRPPT